MSFVAIPGLIGPLIGPTLGGWLVETASWHWIFLINLPVGLVGRGVDVGAFEVRVGLVSQGAQPVEGAVDEKALGSFNQDDRSQRDLRGCRRARSTCRHVVLPFDAMVTP